MQQDVFVPAVWSAPNIALGVARTTQTCQTAQAIHDLTGSAAVALGRLLTSAALLRFATPRQGSMSLQVLADGVLRQLFVDVNALGHLRGYCKGTGSAVATGQRGRIGADVGRGMLSVLRAQTQEEFTRSTTELQTGEIDADVEAFAENSEQIPTVLTCEVLLGADGRIRHAGGAIAQGLPGAQAQHLAGLRRDLGLAEWLRANSEPAAWLEAWQAAACVQAPQAVGWQCRCSRERAVAALQMLPADQLYDMASQAEPAHVDCEFCGANYRFEADALRNLTTFTPSS